jgi:ABC-2 type transport system permease protein
MLNLIQADLFKLCKSSVIKILFGITTLSALTMVIMAYLIPKGQIPDKYTGLGFMFSDINMINILGAVIAGVFICGDFDNKTIHDAIACGCSRGAVIVSKAIVFFCAIGFILLPYAIITGIALSIGSKFDMGDVSVGFLHLLSKESGIVLSTTMLLKSLAVALTLMIVYIAQLSICVPLAIVLKRPVLVVGICYGFSILCGQLAVIADSSTAFGNIFSCTPYGGNYAFVTLDTGAIDLVKAIAVSLVFIILMLALSYSAFRRSEIK